MHGSVTVCMCMSWKCLFFTMNVKSRRFSLDSAVSLDGVGVLHGRRGSSSRFPSKKLGQFKNLDDARLEIQELNRSLDCTREHTITEESFERSDGIINSNSFLKHNKTFHKLFQEIPEEEKLTHTFTCALQKEVPYHGRLFVSDKYLCFYSSVLLKDTKVVITACSISGVKKHNSALSMLSISADGEKYTFVSLRNREMCYKRLQSICWAQGKCIDSSPHLSSAENEADHDLASSYSSLEDSVDHSLSRQNSICLDNSFSLMSSEAPTRRNSTRPNSSTDEDNRAVSWIWRITDGVEMRNISVLFYIYIMLLLLLLLVSGYIGLRIVALEEQLTGLSLQHRD